MSAVRAGAAYVELTTRNRKFLKGLRQAQQRLQDFGGSVRLLGTQMMGLGAAAAGPLAASTAVFASFDDAIRGVRAVTQASAEDFERLRAKAKQLGASTSYSASQVALLMTELGRAGFNPSQIIAMTGAVMNLARATGTDATQASGIMAATLRQFSLEADQASRVADALTTAANKSFNSVESLGEALKYTAPVAADANMSLEETLAILGSLGNLGIQGTNAGTAVRRLLTLSGAAADKFQQEFGVSALDAAGNVRPLVDVLAEVSEAAAKMPSGERARKFSDVFGLLGITAASAVGKSATSTRELYQELLQASGAAESTAKEMDAGIGGAFRILLSAAEGVGIAIGDSIENPLKRVTEAISGVLSAAIEWIQTNQSIVRMAALVAVGLLAGGAALVGMGIAASVAGTAIGGILATLSLVGTAFSVAGAMVMGLLSPLGLAAAAVVGLGAYLLHTSGAGAQALAWLGAQFQRLSAFAKEAFGAIGRALAAGDIAAAGQILWLSLKLVWQQGLHALNGYWQEFKLSFLRSALDFGYSAAGAISTGWAELESLWADTLGFLGDAWAIFTGMLTKTWHSTVGFIRKAWVRLKSLFDADINVDAETARIDTEQAAKSAAADQQLGESMAARDAQRAQRQAEIEAAKDARARALRAALPAADAAIGAQADEAIAASADELAAARQAWEAAVGKLKSDDPAGNSAGGSPAASSLLGNLQSQLNQAALQTATQPSAVDTAATFNAFAIRGLGADSLADRQLRAAEATAENTHRMIRVIEESGMSYS